MLVSGKPALPIASSVSFLREASAGPADVFLFEKGPGAVKPGPLLAFRCVLFYTPVLGFAFCPASAAGACGAGVGVGVGAGFSSSPAMASRMAFAMASTSLCCRRFLTLSTAASAAVTAEKSL